MINNWNGCFYGFLKKVKILVKKFGS